LLFGNDMLSCFTLCRGGYVAANTNWQHWVEWIEAYSEVHRRRRNVDKIGSKALHVDIRCRAMLRRCFGNQIWGTDLLRQPTTVLVFAPGQLDVPAIDALEPIRQGCDRRGIRLLLEHRPKQIQPPMPDNGQQVRAAIAAVFCRRDVDGYLLPRRPGSFGPSQATAIVERAVIEFERRRRSTPEHVQDALFAVDATAADDQLGNLI